MKTGKVVLHLTLKRRWFDLISSGQKTVEYREVKPYWMKRLMIDSGSLRQDFNEIHFRNGYAKDAPFMRVKFNHMTLYAKRFICPQNGEQITADEYFLISLGPVLEVKA